MIAKPYSITINHRTTNGTLPQHLLHCNVHSIR